MPQSSEAPKPQAEKQSSIRNFFKNINIPLPEFVKNAVKFLTGQPNDKLGAAGTNVKSGK
jgi:hypothetical protein